MKTKGEQKHSSTLSSTSGLVGGVRLTSCPRRFTLEKSHTHRMGDWVGVGAGRKISPPSGFDPHTVASGYIDGAMPAIQPDCLLEQSTYFVCTEAFSWSAGLNDGTSQLCH